MYRGTLARLLKVSLTIWWTLYEWVPLEFLAFPHPLVNYSFSFPIKVQDP